MKERRADVIKEIREIVKINSYHTYSEPRKGYQRVKFLGFGFDIKGIKEAIKYLEYEHIKVIDWYGSVILEFPYHTYC